MKKWQKNVFIDFTALLLGSLLTLSFAPYDVFPLAVLAPAGLLFLLLNESPARAFWLGFLFGVGLFTTGIYWIFISVHVIGEVPTFLAVLSTAGVVFIVAMYPAIASYWINRFFPQNSDTKLLCAFPAIFLLCEWWRTWMFSGFAWLLIGYSQTNSPLKGYAPILSVYGVSLAVLLSSGLLINGFLKYQQKAYRLTYFNLFALVAIWTFGALFTLIPWTKPIGDPISVSLVQGNIPQKIKWDPDYLQLSLDRYEQMSEPLWGKSNVIIWPEGALPIPLQEIQPFIEKLNHKATNTKTTLLSGIPIENETKDGYFNAVISLGKENKVYLKRHLVPFGEYIPFANYLTRIFSFLNIPMSNLVAGDMIQPPITVNNVKISTSICYEITFPELILTSDKSIGMLLTVTNDAWFGKSIAQAQHLQMAVMRALELGRPLLMISNDGITAIVGPDGKIEAQAPPYQSYVLTSTVQPTTGLTPWMQNGMDPILFIIIIMLFLAIRAKKRAIVLQQVTQH